VFTGNLAYLRGSYVNPRYWKFVDSFPMTIAGKTQKYRMREIAIEELQLRAAA
jgi:fatty-acyl-CoA synthase